MTRPTAVAGDGLACVILAGGRSRRMGGTAKALLPLGAKPLLRHVIDRVHPQVDELLLSVERRSEAFEAFGLEQLADPVPDRGPLPGLLTAMRKTAPRQDYLMLVPCDAPFVPIDLGAKLLACAVASARPCATIRYETELQPTFSVWSGSLLPRLEHAVLDEGMAGIRQFLEVAGSAELDWPRSEPSPFFNINDQDALQEANRLLERAPGTAKSCSA